MNENETKDSTEEWIAGKKNYKNTCANQHCKDVTATTKGKKMKSR